MKKLIIVLSIISLIALVVWASLHWTKKIIDPEIRICKTSKANIRQGPGINFEKDTVNQLPYSEMLFVLKDSIGWIKFETNKDVTGWVKKDLTVSKEEWLGKHNTQTKNSTSWSGTTKNIGYIFLIIFAIIVYFLPTIVGHKKKNIAAILILNIFLGWTFVGWVVALVWAVSHERK